MDVIKEALHKGQRLLSEYQAKRLLQSYGIPVVKEKLVFDEKGALEAAKVTGFPTVLKFCSPTVAHKTEKGLVELDLRDKADLIKAFRRLRRRTQGMDGGFLIQEFVRGERELMIGITRDPQFGPCVMFGLGGIFAEILEDVSFRVAPIKKQDAAEMMREIKGHKILGAARGMESIDLEALSESLIALGRLGLEQEAIQEVDVNPLIIRGVNPVAVDALVILRHPTEKRARKARMRALPSKMQDKLYHDLIRPEER